MLANRPTRSRRHRCSLSDEDASNRNLFLFGYEHRQSGFLCISGHGFEFAIALATDLLRQQTEFFCSL
jgi:hypothetical protein